MLPGHAPHEARVYGWDLLPYAVVLGGGPQIFPVNYLPEDGTVTFRTGPGTNLAAVLEGGTVALEADRLNSYGTIA